MRIVLIADAVSLPVGMASTQRLTLLSRGLRDAGAEVEILLTRATGSPNGGPPPPVSGQVAGVGYRYVCGSPIQARTRAGRRLQEARGLFAAIRTLARRRRQCGGRLAVITYSRHLSTVVPVGLYCRWAGITCLAEMCEWPVTQATGMTLGRLRRCLFCGQVTRFVDGVIPISRYIEREVTRLAGRMKRRIATCYVPILCEVGEACGGEGDPFGPGPYLLFSGSAGYRKTVAFVLDAFRIVREAHPQAWLVITGIRPEGNGWLRQGTEERGVSDRVILAGFVSRSDLLAGYRRSLALLIPLFDDAQSRARFPTKIGEYLLAGRPVVTSAVGEVTDFLADRETAFFAAPDSAVSFADAILAVLGDPATANRVGAAGRDLAAREFDYRAHGVRLLEWIRQVSGQSAFQSGKTGRG
jgi:glycosyltransferase involved in cell wall biosynthesis